MTPSRHRPFALDGIMVSKAKADRERLAALVDIGLSLSSAPDLGSLFELILDRSLSFTGADGATLHVRERDEFVFTRERCRSIDGRDEISKVGSYRRERLELNDGNLVGWTALRGRPLALADAYAPPEGLPCSFDRSFDAERDYRTRSLLLLPIPSRSGSIIAVLTLANAMNDEGTIIPFPEADAELRSALARQAGIALENLQLRHKVKEGHLDTIQRLAVAAEYKDQDTANHIRRMSQYSTIIAFHYGLPPDKVETLLYASPMHDIGKIGVPDAILLKPGLLTPEERRIMEKHTTIGAQLLSNSDSEIIQMSCVVAMTHHEKWDGSGYPEGLAGEDIPIEGRIVALADVFDALCSKRCYKPAFSFEKSMAIVQEGRGKHFDPAVLDAFLEGLPKVRNIHRRYGD